MTDTKTPYGVIHYGECRDDWRNLRIYDQPPEGGSPVKLQGPALRAFKAAQVRYAKLSGWSAARLKKHPDGRPIILTGSWRSRAYQRQLYASDPKRYAPPCSGLHPDGLAIDVSTAQANQEKIRKALAAEGWKQFSPGESWHHSFWITG